MYSSVLSRVVGVVMLERDSVVMVLGELGTVLNTEGVKVEWVTTGGGA